jgi:fluoroacetyl-CoA thioesterase
MGELDPGLSATRHLRVGDEDTAARLGSGDVPVLATPRLLALAEAACVDAIRDELDGGKTTVGVHAEVDHDKPSPVGAEVDLEATLIGHHGRRLEFNVVFRQDREIVARIQHRRVIVDRQRFLERCGASADQAP